MAEAVEIAEDVEKVEISVEMDRMASIHDLTHRQTDPLKK